jgi:hypothetical protein
MNGLRPQTPSAGFDWLYKDFEENHREFSKLIYLGVNDTPWCECTQAEREQWEEEHKPKTEPEDIEPQTEE